MAEGFFKKMTRGRSGEFSCSSAGVSAMDGLPSTDETVRAMKEEGVDVSGHRSRQLTPALVGAADKIFVMEKMHKDWILDLFPEAKNKVHLLTEFASPGQVKMTGTGIPDPIRMSYSFYKNVLDIIHNCVKNLAESL